MSYVRWYDKDPYLSPMMKILEKLPHEVQNMVAQDLLQIITNVPGIQNDDNIEYLNKSLLPEYRRWYDINPDLLSSIEILKNASEQTKKEACEAVLDYLFQIVTREQAKND